MRLTDEKTEQTIAKNKETANNKRTRFSVNTLDTCKRACQLFKNKTTETKLTDEKTEQIEFFQKKVVGSVGLNSFQKKVVGSVGLNSFQKKVEQIQFLDRFNK